MSVSEKELGITELASWVLSAPVGEARTVGIRSDGNQVVTIKRYLNASIVNTEEFSLSAFRKFSGIPKRRSHGTDSQTEQA